MNLIKRVAHVRGDRLSLDRLVRQRIIKPNQANEPLLVVALLSKVKLGIAIRI